MILLTYLALVYVVKMIKFPILGISDTVCTIILTGIWIILAFLPMVLNYQFISYSDKDDYIIFRYFTAGMVGGRKNSVELSKKLFAGYKIETKLFGLIQGIILFQKVQGGVAKYPPIYINALTRKEKAKVIESLDKFVLPA